jgi:hypothetical protein
MEVDGIAQCNFVNVEKWTGMTCAMTSNNGVTNVAGQSSFRPEPKTLSQRRIAYSQMQWCRNAN